MPSRRNVDQLDGTLLRVLCALVEARSVTLAARRLGQTQPAVSGSLKRLRAMLGDPLLVREKLAMVPTPRALAAAEKARGVLALLGELAEPEAFDPARAGIAFHLASPDYLAPSFLTEVARRIGTEAPGCTLALHPLAAAPLTLARWLEAGHVVPMPYSSVQRGVVETHLAELGVERDARVVVPYFGLAPHVVAATDLVFTTARHFAESFAATLPLEIVEAPAGFPAMRFYQLWHERAHHVPAHRWLRALIGDVARLYFAPAKRALSRAR